MVHKYTKEQADFIADNVKNRGNAELTEMFNRYFGLSLSISKIKRYKANHKLSSGLDGRFKPGHVSFNKGKKGVGGWEPTQFKKGNNPWNYKPIGAERVDGYGYTNIKIANPNVWKGKHILIWEKENGPVPKGHVVIFGDGNKCNFDINNLILVSRAQLAVLNKHKLIFNNTELTKAGIVIADIYRKIGEVKRR
ncbi:MAG: HNH endonuclease signature motif containing protein [Clostridia bacterium]|nr:HNH endonuclease signature motif containing protein [Clostridia bacterium]MDD4049369.1 HNH endonuclease signature motif containing protein [Clostridia bacterium]